MGKYWEEILSSGDCRPLHIEDQQWQQATAYPTYIDGKGMRTVGKRWQRYCWKCRDYWDLYNTPLSARSSPTSASNQDQSSSQADEAMGSRHPNPFQVRNPWQQPWSFDGIMDTSSDAVPPQHRTPFLPDLHIGRRRNVSPPSTRPTRHRESSAQWHNPSAVVRSRLPLIPIRDVMQQSEHGAGARTSTHPRGGSSHYANTPPAESNTQQPVYALGTREEVQADDYVSPIANLYGRAWNRYREAEERRASYREQVILNDLQRDEATTADPAQILSTRPSSTATSSQDFNNHMEGLRRAEELQARERLDRATDYNEMIIRVRQLAMLHLEADRRSNPFTNSLAQPDLNPIDVQTSRPAPLPEEELIAGIQCRVCCEQRMDTLLEPCMHLAICHWCSEVMQARVRRFRFDPEHGDERWKCPICRRRVTQARRIYMAL